MDKTARRILGTFRVLVLATLALLRPSQPATRGNATSDDQGDKNAPRPIVLIIGVRFTRMGSKLVSRGRSRKPPKGRSVCRDYTSRGDSHGDRVLSDRRAQRDCRFEPSERAQLGRSSESANAARLDHRRYVLLFDTI